MVAQRCARDEVRYSLDQADAIVVLGFEQISGEIREGSGRRTASAADLSGVPADF
jgi:hypothetical protein